MFHEVFKKMSSLFKVTFGKTFLKNVGPNDQLKTTTTASFPAQGVGLMALAFYGKFHCLNH